VSPREFEPGVVHARISLIRELLADLDTVGAVSVSDLEQDRMLRHAVERILVQLVELAVSINSHVAATQLGRAPADYRSSFDLASDAGMIDAGLARSLRDSVGLRNVLTHEYVAVDLGLVAESATLARTHFAEYLKQVAGWLNSLTR